MKAAIWLVLALLMAPMPLQGQSTPDPPPSPLDVQEIWFDPGVPQWNGATPTTTNVHIRVENTGERTSSGFSITYLWEDAQGQTTLLNGEDSDDAGKSTDLGKPLAPGESWSRYVKWQVQPEHKGAGRIVVELEESTTKRSYRDVFVPVHAISVQPDPDSLTLGPDETAILPIILHNDGNVVEEVEWTLIDVSTRLEASFRDAVTSAPPGESMNALVIRYPWDGNNDPAEESIGFKTATPSGMEATWTTKLIHIDPSAESEGSGIAVDSPGPAFFEPGQAKTLLFAVTNTGSQADHFTLASSADDGWQVSAPTTEDDEQARLALDAGEQATVALTVTAPTASVEPGSVALEARADLGGEATGLVALRIHGSSPHVTSVGLAERPVYADDDVNVAVGLANRGDGDMEDATLSVVARYADGTQTTTHTTLAPVSPDSESDPVVPIGIATAPGPLTLEVTLADDDRLAHASRVVFIREADFNITAPEASHGAPGETVLYTTPPQAFRITNRGNAAEAFDLESQGAEIMGAKRISLAPDETRTIGIRQALPTHIGDQENIAAGLTVRLANSTERFVSAIVNTSVQDTTRPSIAWQSMPTNIAAGQTTRLGIDVSDATEITAAWLILDSGTSATRLNLTSTIDGWAALFRWDAPGTYHLTPHATDSFNNEGEGPIQQVTVLNVTPPQLQVSAVEGASPGLYELVVDTDATSVRLVVNGSDAGSHPVHAGLARIEVVLDPGHHVIEISAALNGQTVRKTLAIDVEAPDPEEPAGVKPNDDGKKAPGAPLWIAIGIALALRRRR